MQIYNKTLQKSSQLPEGDSGLTTTFTFATHGGPTVISNACQEPFGIGQPGQSRPASTQFEIAPRCNRSTPQMEMTHRSSEVGKRVF